MIRSVVDRGPDADPRYRGLCSYCPATFLGDSVDAVRAKVWGHQSAHED